MEKIKSILSPGKQTDDEIMYGSQATPSQQTTGQGSHFDHTGNARLNDPNTASEPVRGQAFTSEGNISGSMADTHGIRQESNIHQENYRGQEPHSSGLGSSNYGSTNAGPHDSNLANKADPRVDSDRDGRAGLGNTHNTTSGTGLGSSNYGSTNAGPHDSNLANKMDPRVDSDRDGRSGMGNTSGSRQNMPGRFPTESTNETVHNPYTSHEVDPRIGGSTQQTSNQPISGMSGTNTTGAHGTSTSSHMGGKGLNAARTEDYAQDDSHHGRDAAIGGAGVTGAAALAMKHHQAGNEYSGTTASGNNQNYYGAPSGTATGASTTTGPHNSSIINKLDPRVDSDRDGRSAMGSSSHNNTGAGIAGTHHQSTNFGPHDSNLANKADPRVDSDRDGRSGLETTHTTGNSGYNTGVTGGNYGHSSTAGPHDSNIANKADTRVDSELDGRSGMQSSHRGTGAGLAGVGLAGAGVAGTHHQSTNVGPHDSKLANKVDPRVDSDLDGRSEMPGTGAHNTHGTTTTTSGTGAGMHGGSHHGATNAGPHDSNVANKLDPRVDSNMDRRGSRRGSAINLPPPQGALAAGLMTDFSEGHGAHGSHNTHGSTNAGPHDSNVANKLDPRVDSDRDGRAGMGNTHGTHGAAGGLGSFNHGSTNAGPHDSNLANKADPRVDSDRDGRAELGNSHGTHNTHDSRNTHDSQGGLLSKVKSALTGGAAGGTAGHHGSSNVNDPSYASGTQSTQDYPTHLRENHGTSQQYSEQHNDHTLRNTALGAGAAGVGAHEYSMHNQNTTTGVHGADTTRDTSGRDRFYGKESATAGTGGVGYTQTGGTGIAQHGTTQKPYTDNQPMSGSHGLTGASGPASNTSGPHKSNVMNKLDPRVDENYAATATTGSRGVSQNIGGTDRYENTGYDSHGNRTDVAGGGMALSNDPATQHYTEHAHGLDDPAYAKSGAGYYNSASQHGVGSAHQKPIPLDGVELPRGNQYGQEVKDPRYGLPMSAAGVTAAEAETLRHHDDDLMAKHAAHDKRHGSRHDDTTHGTTHEKKRRSSLLGFLHRDKNKKYTKEEEAEFDRQEREQNARSGLTGAGVCAAGVGAAEKNKPLPLNPGQQGASYNQDQQMNLTDRTRQHGDTTNAPAYSGGMVDVQGNPIRDQSTMGGEIPYDQSDQNRGNATGYGSTNAGPHGSTLANKADPRVDSDRDHRAGPGMTGSAYPQGPSDGRDYPAGGMGTGEGVQTKVLEKDGGHKVLHKKSHIIHPGAGAGETGYQGGAGAGTTGGNY